jgi:hypothetical protein
MKSLRTYLVLLCALALTSRAGVSAIARPASPAAAQAASSSAGDIKARAPAIVFIIRHAEKPLDDKSGDLSPQGFKRAGVLPYLFLPLPGSTAPPRLPRPDALFASDASGKSNRPMETIMPLAQALHLTISHDFIDRETAGVAKQVMSGKYAGKVVLICWHHGEIPHLAKAFGVEDAPKVWNDTVFDQIWKIQWVDGHPHMTTLPEALLKGDSTQ